MPHPLHNRGFLKELDFTAEGRSPLLELATQLKVNKKADHEAKRLTGKNITLIFEKTSTHTRCSFKVAAYDQGAQVTYLDPSGSQMGHKESMADTARVLGRFYDGIEFRDKKQEHIKALTELSGVPVWSGLTDEWHLIQILTDRLTMLEYFDKPIEQISFVYLGDARNNVANLLLIPAALMGMDMQTVVPKEPQTSPEAVAQAEKLAKDSGARILITDDTAQGIKGVNFLYTGVWVSMGEPKEVWDQHIALFAPYRISTQLVEATGNPDVEFPRCLPAFHGRNTTIGEDVFARTGMKGPEVADGVFETERSVTFDQAENRMCTTKAVVVATLGRWD